MFFNILTILNLNFTVKFVKNQESDTCAAIKQGLYYRGQIV